MYKLKIIIASTREGRKGPSIAQWIYKIAREDAQFDVGLIDLADINLPMFNEPNHPRLKKYTHQYTLNWSAIIEPTDAFIIVTPEYNHGFPASIKNAIDYLSQEWGHKAVGFVSYGGISAGTRAVQMLKPVLSALKMVPVTEAVAIPSFNHFINENGEFVPNEEITKSAGPMLSALHTWTEALIKLRTEN